jgi:hypothetical protein
MIQLCDEKLGIGPCSICERERRMAGKDISLKEGIDFLREAGMRVIVIGEGAVDTGDNPNSRTIAALAITYISYVKERYPSVHHEADGSPSIEGMIQQYIHQNEATKT